ncbi:hypothetical protein GCM10007978_16680 [Shewanella hanedai]|uniref:Dinitrogenase iron-molybdenum cofactor biosynthesis protein n=1 Tax=Shewanella hanedai TaxID=25 RepID=A0A553JSH0_SHEHA|nr:NifB/NifX family molybdenum-iron cluster-binding protein [Shewanella hanedai]TRY15408.1 dinitrogenase iron-molybdenum cofactor biosynthesis protein [Shewanella hanedai]GGI79518.1 hypothetical protein GCM10007978_16680 [Shewanella hanedai]
MIIAVPLSRGRLASHFTKAKEIAFYNEQQQLIARFDNPALAGSCSAKKAMLTLIKDQGTSIVLVEEIGQRILGKLLAAGISVSRCNRNMELTELFSAAIDLSRRLVDVEQGRECLNHEKKGGCGSGCGGSAGGCGCSSKKSEPNLLSQLAPQLNDKPVTFAGFRPL